MFPHRFGRQPAERDKADLFNFGSAGRPRPGGLRSRRRGTFISAYRSWGRCPEPTQPGPGPPRDRCTGPVLRTSTGFDWTSTSPTFAGSGTGRVRPCPSTAGSPAGCRGPDPHGRPRRRAGGAVLHSPRPSRNSRSTCAPGPAARDLDRVRGRRGHERPVRPLPFATRGRLHPHDPVRAVRRPADLPVRRPSRSQGQRPPHGARPGRARGRREQPEPVSNRVGTGRAKWSSEPHPRWRRTCSTSAVGKFDRLEDRSGRGRRPRADAAGPGANRVGTP